MQLMVAFNSQLKIPSLYKFAIHRAYMTSSKCDATTHDKKPYPLRQGVYSQFRLALAYTTVIYPHFWIAVNIRCENLVVRCVILNGTSKETPVYIDSSLGSVTVRYRHNECKSSS